MAQVLCTLILLLHQVKNLELEAVIFVVVVVYVYNKIDQRSSSIVKAKISKRN